MYKIKILNDISNVGLNQFNSNYEISKTVENEDAILLRSADIHEYEFKRLWKKNLRDNNKNLYWSIFSLALAIITFLCKDYGFAGFFFGFYLATFASYFSYNSKYKQYRAHYQKIIEGDF